MGIVLLAPFTASLRGGVDYSEEQNANTHVCSIPPYPTFLVKAQL